jgi:hypothetical protein
MMHHDSIETHTSRSRSRTINTLQLSAEHMGGFIHRFTVTDKLKC